jgi:catechol 2,3-dioxygenase-like lactoylglutathione lyase family enzyme
MRLGYVIVYVADVPTTLDFYHRAFGLARRFLHESQTYGELETGGTALAFAHHSVATGSLPGGYVAADATALPLGMEIGLIAADVPVAVAQALAAGATLVLPATVKPWGQTVAYVRAPEGTLVEICTAIGE